MASKSWHNRQHYLISPKGMPPGCQTSSGTVCLESSRSQGESGGAFDWTGFQHSRQWVVFAVPCFCEKWREFPAALLTFGPLRPTGLAGLLLRKEHGESPLLVFGGDDIGVRTAASKHLAQGVEVPETSHVGRHHEVPFAKLVPVGQQEHSTPQ